MTGDLSQTHIIKAVRGANSPKPRENHKAGSLFMPWSQAFHFLLCPMADAYV